MTTINLRNHRVDREVERLFKEHPPKYNRLCQNPVTGGNYIGIIDSTKHQKELARQALLAREWFKLEGPADAQPFPVSYDEREDLKRRGFLLLRIVAWFARSLEGRAYDTNEHPPFADYVSGVLWEAELPEGAFVALPDYPAEELLALKNRYPPRMLKGMSTGARWLPPEKHAQLIAGLRRASNKPDHYFARH